MPCGAGGSPLTSGGVGAARSQVAKKVATRAVEAPQNHTEPWDSGRPRRARYASGRSRLTPEGKVVLGKGSEESELSKSKNKVILLPPGCLAPASSLSRAPSEGLPPMPRHSLGPSLSRGTASA